MVYLPQPDVDLTLATHVPIDWDSNHNGLAAPAPEDVLLIPGKLTEVTARIKNNSQQELRISLGVQGDFPGQWFTRVPSPQVFSDETWREAWRENVQITRGRSLQFATDYFQLRPQQTIAINLGFTLTSSFFEDPNALRSKPHLNLSYGGEIFLHQATESSQDPAVQLIAYKTLQFYPRPGRIYQKFLPELYQESDFLGRFLNIAEQSFEPVYETSETFWSYLDPLLTPRALVPFLAHWVAWPMSPSLTLSQQRRLIRHAVEIYQWRGTARGLKLCLRLCTGLDDPHIEVLEPDEREFAVGAITLGDEPCLGGGKVYHFVVRLKPETQDQLSNLDETAIRTLIEQEKPAFCTYDLEILYPAAISPSSTVSMPQSPKSDPDSLHVVVDGAVSPSDTSGGD